MKNLLTITFLFIAGFAFAQPVRTTITDDGVNVTVQTPVNIKVIPICDFHWVFVDGQLKMWIEGGNELIPGGRLGNFTVNGATTQQTKLDALGAISAQCSGGGAGGTLTDGNKGDVTVSDSGSVWNINAGVIGSTEIANGGVAWVDLAQAVKDSIGSGGGGGAANALQLPLGFTEVIGTVSTDSTGEAVQAIAELLDVRATATGVVVDWEKKKIFGTSASPVTGNVTFNFANSAVDEQYMIHKSFTAPTFPATAIVEGTYISGTNNLINFRYINTSVIGVSINRF